MAPAWRGRVPLGRGTRMGGRGLVTGRSRAALVAWGRGRPVAIRES